jgi:hypothetical protein
LEPLLQTSPEVDVGKRVRRSVAEQRFLVREWRESGRSQREFCRNTDIPPASLSRWARRFRETEFVELRVDEPFVDPQPEPPDLLVVLPSQITISVSCGFDDRELRRLIQALTC